MWISPSLKCGICKYLVKSLNVFPHDQIKFIINQQHIPHFIDKAATHPILEEIQGKQTVKSSFLVYNAQIHKTYIHTNMLAR